jgi:hypothetical protein
MSRKTQIIDALIAAIAQRTASHGQRGLAFLHEVNTFPYFYVHVDEESRTHISSDVRLAILSTSIRGYCWAETADPVELYARQIEESIQHFAESGRPLIYEARVQSIRTDEGLMRPYGLVDIKAQILYEVEQ